MARGTFPATTHSKTPIPQPAEVRRTGKVVSIDSGDHRQRVREARNRLVEEHAGMVRGIAERVLSVVPRSIELDDLIQTGMVALIHAATRYRPQEHGGAPFGAYARKCVRGAILDSVSGRNWIEAKLAELPDMQEQPHLEPSVAPTIEGAIDDTRLARHVQDAIEYLDETSQRLLAAYYRDGATLESAGAECGLPRRQAGEAHASAIRRLQQILHVR